MSAKNCTTHHLACDCIEAKREAEIKGLLDLLREWKKIPIGLDRSELVRATESAIECYDKGKI
jgi:hypothetical protein